MTAPIIGPRTLEHLRNTIAACEVELTPEELGQIDEIVPSGRWASDFYDGNVQGRLRGAIATGDVPTP